MAILTSPGGTDTLTLRDYQEQAVEAVLAGVAAGQRRVLIVMATGTGKTVAFSEIIRRWPALDRQTALVLAHRSELLDQAAAKIRAAMPQASISVEKAEQSAYWGSDVVVASIQTLAQNGAARARKLAERLDLGLVVYDECFPAGTLVDGIPIETIRLGARVNSFNHVTGRVERRRVTRRFVSEARCLVRLSFRRHPDLVCTSEHPIYCAGPDGRIGYVPASQLTSGHVAAAIEWGSEVINSWENVAAVEPIAVNPDRCRRPIAPDGLVYNLEVEGNHNYFANGVLVHNCHHSPAPGNKAALKALGCWDADGPFLLGCTATPNRGDKRGLGQIFEAEAFNMGLQEAIGGGWLCPLAAYRVETGVDISGVGTTAGEFVQSQLAAAVNHRERSLLAVQYWQKLAVGRPTLAFCVDVAHAEDTAALFVEEGVRAAAVSGRTEPEERARLLAAFSGGQLEVLCNAQLLTEGIDLPKTSCVIMLRPTKSQTFYAQSVGRGTRTAAGKDDCLIIDLVDNCRRNRLVTAPVLLGLPESLDAKGQRLDKVREQVDRSGVPPSRLEGLRSVDELTHRCEEWDLFAALELPDDLKKLTGRTWAPWRDGYRLRLQNGEVTILPDDLGRFVATAVKGGKTAGSVTSETLAEAFRRADLAVGRLWGDAAAWANEKARWVKEPASPKQLGFLKRLGAPPELMDGLTKGKACRLIDSLVERQRAAAAPAPAP